MTSETVSPPWPDIASGDLVEVTWHDSERVLLGWADAADYIAALNDRTVYRTAGYFVGRDADHIMVALSRSDRGLFNDAVCIPMCVVVETRRVESPSSPPDPRP